MSGFHFQPRLVHDGEDIPSVNARFVRESAEFALQWRCPDCAYFRPSDQQCSLHWPNARMLLDPVVILDERADPAFCKLYETAE